jgi:hypothetical protein
MKKLFLIAVLSILSYSTYAWKGRFTTSCGVTLQVDSGTDNIHATINYLRAINGNICGYTNVSITFR